MRVSSHLPGRALVTAALAGSVDFVPIPSGGAQAALSGAEIRYVVGQSLKSQWLIVTRAEHQQARGPQGQDHRLWPRRLRRLRRGRDRDAARFFNMEVGKDYKVISFQGEPERIAALINGDIDAALISVPHAPKALDAGMKVLVRTGDYIQRAGGTIWTRKAFADEHPERLTKFIRAIAKAVMYLPRQQGRLDPDAEGASRHRQRQGRRIVWDETHNTLGAELPRTSSVRFRIAAS